MEITAANLKLIADRDKATYEASLAAYRQSDRSNAATVAALTRWLTAGHGETEAFRFIPGIAPAILTAAQEQAAHALYV